MTLLGPILQTFFSERLQNQRRASPHTVAAYRDTFRLLLRFAQQKLGKEPSNVLLADVDAELVTGFLDHLERERNNSARTRNARLAAIRSFFRYAAHRQPDHLGIIERVLAIPQKRFDRKLVSFLSLAEIEALLAAPDQQTWIGRRDHTLLLVAIQTGLRVSELVGLQISDVVLDTGPHIRCTGKGRKERCTPLTRQTVAVLREWLRHQDAEPTEPLFQSRRGGPLSRDAVERLVAKHAAAARTTCPSLASKHVTPHVLRHSTAVQLLQPCAFPLFKLSLHRHQLTAGF